MGESGGTAIPRKKIFPDLEVTAKIRLREDYKNNGHAEYFALISLKCGGRLKESVNLHYKSPEPIEIPIKEATYYLLKSQLNSADFNNPEIIGKSKLEFSVQKSEENTTPAPRCI